MTTALFAAAILLAVNCSAQEMPKIGDTWTGATNSGKLYVFPPYSLQDRIKFTVDSIQFNGAVTEDKEIIFVSTSDPDFTINGKKYIGLPFSYLENKADAITLLGWGSYVKINEEWYAAFDYKAPPTNSSRVAFVFKGKTPKGRIVRKK